MDDDARPAARLTVLSGPSGVGKDSVIELIRVRSPWIKLSVSVTTRKMRDYETDGEHYHFVTRSEFQRLGYIDLATKALTPLSSGIDWDVEEFELSPDGRTIVFATNDAGSSTCGATEMVPPLSLTRFHSSSLKWQQWM